MENKYWFTLSSSIFIWKKGNDCYLYDSDQFIGELFPVHDFELEVFIVKLQNPDNLYCVELLQSELESGVLGAFIKKLISIGMARLTPQEEVKGYRPIQLPPILNLQSEVGRLKDKKLTDMTVGDHVLRNLHEIHIMLSKEVDSTFVNSLVVLLDSLVGSFVSNITISGYCQELNRYEEFWKQLEVFQISKIFIFSLEDISENLIGHLSLLNILNLKVKIVVSSSYTEDLLKKIEILFDSFFINHEWEFLVSNDRDNDAIDNVILIINPDHVHIKPHFDGTNITFFEKYVYVEKSDIQNSSLTKKNIFTHKVLNTSDFGKLIIASDGNVHANIYHEPLGTLQDDIRELVCKEMNNGTSWRRIRDMKPCCDCVYQWLCPPPSNLEIILNKPNLCHVMP